MTRSLCDFIDCHHWQLTSSKKKSQFNQCLFISAYSCSRDPSSNLLTPNFVLSLNMNSISGSGPGTESYAEKQLFRDAVSTPCKHENCRSNTKTLYVWDFECAELEFFCQKICSSLLWGFRTLRRSRKLGQISLRSGTGTRN